MSEKEYGQAALFTALVVVPILAWYWLVSAMLASMAR